MRCWQCNYVIAMPDIVNGEPGKPGMIRRKEIDPALTPQTVTTEFTCTRCGTMYNQTTNRLPGKATPNPEPETDEQRDRRRGWN